MAHEVGVHPFDRIADMRDRLAGTKASFSSLIWITSARATTVMRRTMTANGSAPSIRLVKLPTTARRTI